MWNQLISRLYEDAEFAAPASREAIDQIERWLGPPVPSELRDLLRHTDGVRAEHGSGLVWPTRKIIERNSQFRQDADFAELYMSFDQLLFFGDDGGGNQFAHVQVPAERPDVFMWDHETDERRWVARSLADYLQRRAGDDDW